MKINIADLLKSPPLKTNFKPSESVPVRGNFMAVIAKSLHPKARHPFQLDRQTPQGMSPAAGTDHSACLEALRNGMLATGKPFDQAHIKREDLHLVQNLLTQLGYTTAQSEQCLQDLASAGRDGDVPLSQLLTQLEQLGAPQEKQALPLVLGASAVPYLQLILQDFQLDPAAIRKVLHAGRTAAGDLEFNQVIQTLENVSRSQTRPFSGIVDLNKSQSVVQDLQRMGIQVPPNKKSGLLHIEDFITALKRVSGTLADAARNLPQGEAMAVTPEILGNLSVQMPQTGGRKAVAPQRDGGQNSADLAGPTGKTIPGNVQSAINQVLSHVVDSPQKKDSLTAILTDSKIQFDDPVAKQLQADKVSTKRPRLAPQAPTAPQQLVVLRRNWQRGICGTG